ncbi:hypothetical protein [Methanogenium cariaci]|uniref:hypothetical protein n=1 Tax=Methanogenium cariaci TaxID=2197 RepID=UPI000784F7D4|nr:hypothetical protein [Methanogenium cariaci]
MALHDRSMGYELSNVEKEIACNQKYRDVGYVRHDREDGFFYLDYSPYLPNTKKEIYYTDGIRLRKVGMPMSGLKMKKPSYWIHPVKNG